ncbi:MAG: ParB/RepB/Spo0J family partition protein, partial [Lentisphaerae bacterium]|nr:ParB/RepB/Spo0J family partition protein [Lentisphaerota bacterium]
MVTMTPAPATTYEKGNLYQIPITDFKPDPDQPRKVIDPDALAELTASIAKIGVIQPLLFRVEAGNPYLIIVAGERRYAAAQKAGLFVLPAICVTGDYAEIALIENLQRQDLTAVEEAEALLRLKDEQKYTDEQLAGVIGKARTTLTEMLSLNRLPLAIRNECRGDRKITKSILIEIARKK